MIYYPISNQSDSEDNRIKRLEILEMELNKIKITTNLDTLFKKYHCHHALLTVSECCQILGISRRSLLGLIDDGILYASDIGLGKNKIIRVSIYELNRYLTESSEA